MTDRIRPVSTVLLACVVGAALMACKKRKRPPPPLVTGPAQPATTGGAPAAPRFLGTYAIRPGTNPDGSKYSGSVMVSRESDHDAVSWTIGGGDSYYGVAIEAGGLLGVGWSKKKAGVVVYKVSGGTLTGKWATSGAPSVGTEILSGPAGAAGSYTIVSSSSPTSHRPYHGKVTISPKGGVRLVHWVLTRGEHYDGVGMLDGDVLVVGWGSGVGVGVYHATASGGLTGRTAAPGTSGIGTEVLARR